MKHQLDNYPLERGLPPGLLPLDQTRALVDALKTMRLTLEWVLFEAMSTRDTTGACLHAALLAEAAINRWTGLTAVIRGGGPLEGPELGYFDGSGWKGHYWVEVQKRGNPVAVADLASDQFGGPPVQLLEWSIARAQYRAGAQAAVDEAVAEARPRDS